MAAGTPLVRAAALSEVALLDAANKDLLVAALDEQIASGSFDARISTGLLKLFQFHPALLDLDTVHKVLVKSLLAHPTSAFSLNLFLLPERVLALESVKALQALDRHLRSGELPAFWALAHAEATRPIVGLVPGFDAAARTLIAEVLSHTYQQVPLVVLQESLALEGAAAVGAFCATVGWTWDAARAQATIPPSGENQPRPKRFEESIKFTEIAELVHVLTR